MAAATDDDRARDAGWRWLATLPRAVTAHAHRGEDPLAAVRTLLAELGDPQAGLRVVHIAGSKGKGSTALFTEALLRALGRRTFTFTSPHLERWTERLRLDGDEVDGATGLAALEAVRAASARCGVTPGFFEALTAAGLWLAREAGSDWAVIECGVGGRADATNVVQPAATVITGIEREHVDRLGSELTSIAGEKAGIVKPGAPLIAPAMPAPIDTVLARAADSAAVEFLRVREAHAPPPTAGSGRSVTWHSDGEHLSAAGPGWHVRTRVAAAGRCNAGNATLALAAVAGLGLAPGEDLRRAGRILATTPLPGRAEVISGLPWVMIDSAHTAASAEALAHTVRELGARQVHLLLSCSAGKDVDAVVRPLLPLVGRVTATRADPHYSVDAASLAGMVAAVDAALPVTAVEDVGEALARASADHPGETLVLAAGSVYLAGAVRAAFRAH